MNKAVFLDKDGTLIDDVPYNVDPNLITLSKNSLEGLKALDQSGYLLIVVSNQSGVAKGYFTEEMLVTVENKINELFKKEEIKITAYYYCPHHPEGTIDKYAIECDCRKPKPGLIQSAANKFDIDVQLSWMIGDILNDVEAGTTAGCKTILIDNGNETEWLEGKNRIPTQTVDNINKAAAFILMNAVHE